MNHRFPCGTLPLDFVGTLRARRNPEPIEKLAGAQNLDAWFRESGMVDHDLGSDQLDLDAALTLREAIYALAFARVSGDDYASADMATVNRFAAEPAIVPELTRECKVIHATPRQALSALARETIDVLTGPDGELLRECSRPECTQVYIDRSRGHRREWCSMSTCGNRMKAAAFRARHKSDAATA